MTPPRQVEKKDMLRLLTAGSVDDGKSTLIGRLLHDSKQIYNDHLDSLKKDSSKKGCGNGLLDYSLLLDGLKAEREQNITIDVAYRYFSTAQRKFIIADTPGHEQYTRNMATGASTASLLLLLINAQRGILPQTRRHVHIANLMGIQDIVVVVNKMDLVDYSKAVFEQIKKDYNTVFSSLQCTTHFIPISASNGDNVVTSSSHMPWFQGTSLLKHLEEVSITQNCNLTDLRFPIQLVLRPDQHFRGYAGTIASGVLKKGDPIIALPSGRKSRIRSIMHYKEELDQALPSQAVTVVLEDEIDLSRGDMLVHANQQTISLNNVETMLLWMDNEKMGMKNSSYLMKHTTQTVPALIDEVVYKLDIHTNQNRQTSERLACNEIACVKLKLHRPIFADPYAVNKTTGNFILIDRLSNQTVAAGIILETAVQDGVTLPSSTAVSRIILDTAHNRVQNSFSKSNSTPHGRVIWLTGLSGAGKTTIAYGLKQKLHETGIHTCILDGDEMRQGLNRDLGFSAQDRAENIRRIGEVASLLAREGFIAIVAAISPYSQDRIIARKMVPKECFFEIFLDTPLEICERRDPKKLYQKARAGNIPNFTGLSAPYERPQNPELILNTEIHSVDECINKILQLL